MGARKKFLSGASDNREEEMRSRVRSTAATWNEREQNAERARKETATTPTPTRRMEACSGGIPITGSSPAPKRTCLLQPGTCSSPHPRPDRVHAGRWMNIAPRGEKVRKPKFD